MSDIKNTIPTEIADSLQKAATAYAESTATTNAGVVLRLVAKIIPVSFAIKLFAHLLRKQK